MDITFILVVVIGMNSSPDHNITKYFGDYKQCEQAAADVKGQLIQLADQNKLFDWTGNLVDKVDIETYCTPVSVIK